MLLLNSIDLKSQDLIVTYSGDSMNVKIESILSDRLVYRDNQGEKDISFREVKNFKRDYYQSTYKEEDYYMSTSTSNPKQVLKGHGLQMHAGIHYAWGYSLADIPDNLGEFEKAYMKELKSGYSYGFNIGFFVDENITIGISVNKYRSYVKYSNVIFQTIDTSLIMDIHDDINIHFYAPSIFFRFSDNAENVNFLLGFSLGYTTFVNNSHGPIITGYKNSKYSFGESDILLEGSSMGFGLSFSSDFKLENHLYLGPYFDFYSGVITSYTYSDNTGTFYLENVAVDQGLTVARISLGAKLSVYF